MSSLNPTTHEILTGMSDAFAKIEVQDKAVNRIHMPMETFLTICGDRDPITRHHEEFDGKKLNVKKLGLGFAWLDHNNKANIPNYENVQSEKLGSIWGAEVFSSSKFEVVSDYPHFPANINTTRFDIGRFPPIYGNAITETPTPFVSILEPVRIVVEKLELLRKNLQIIIKSRAKPVFNVTPQENRAIDTLREMITEEEYRKYLKFGFVLVKGQSGLIYKIFRNESHTKVWKNGKVIEEICVRIKDHNIPPTDNVIAFKTIIETNENQFHKIGNVFKIAM
jgi:hypothetical protein